MNFNLEKYDIGLIIDALESYQLDIEHGNANGHAFICSRQEIPLALAGGMNWRKVRI